MNICDLFRTYVEYVVKKTQITKQEIDFIFDDYRDIDVEGRKTYMKKQLGKLPIYGKLRQLSVMDKLMEFDATSLNLTAKGDEKSINKKSETGYSFNSGMKNEVVEIFNSQAFIQVSGISEMLKYNPKDSKIQQLQGKEGVRKTEMARMRTACTIDALTGVDIQEIVEVDGKILKIYERVIY